LVALKAVRPVAMQVVLDRLMATGNQSAGEVKFILDGLHPDNRGLYEAAAPHENCSIARQRGNCIDSEISLYSAVCSRSE
jgi:hypothetical protein